MEKQSGPETVDCKRTAAGGKTESIRRFGEQNYKSVISINFVEEPKYKMITTDGYKAEGIIKIFPGLIRQNVL